MTQEITSLVGLIEQQHHWIDGLFQAHQEALVEKRLEATKSLYACFHRALKVHAQAEDTLLLERHRHACTDPKWNTNLYMHEHRKIYDLLDKLAMRIAQLECISTQDVIEILDEEKTLKGVIEHHGEREEKGMMQELDVALSEQEQLTLTQQLQGYWQEAHQQIRQNLAGLQVGLI